MNNYIIIEDDILNANTHFIIHQVNCQGKMASGVAKAIRNKHPEVYTEYIKHLEKREKENKSALGDMQVIYVNMCGYKGIINMFTQDKYGYDGKQYTDLKAFKECLESINEYCNGVSVAFPWKIACVRGGADWNVVLPMICSTLTNVKEITFYKV